MSALQTKPEPRTARADGDEAAVRDFLNLGALNLSRQAAAWAARDRRYGEVAPFIYGARVLRQHPVECLFEFVCSSNNHISRIGAMVEHLCTAYGTRLAVHSGAQGSYECCTACAHGACTRAECLACTEHGHVSACAGVEWRSASSRWLACLRAPPGCLAMRLMRSVTRIAASLVRLRSVAHAWLRGR